MSDKHLATDWLQFGDEWDEVRAQAALRHIVDIQAQLKTCESQLQRTIAALELIIAMAGNPEAAEGCRLIMNLAIRTLAKIKKVEE